MITAVLATLIGYGPVNYTIRKESFLLKFTLSFLVGFFLLIIPPTISIYSQRPISEGFVKFQVGCLLLFSLIVFLISLRKKASEREFKPQKDTLDVQRKLLAGGIIIPIVASFILNTYWPVSTWDSISLYDLRGKIYARGELLTNLWQQVRENPQELSYYYSYPPTTSLAHSIEYLLSDNAVMILYSFFYLVLVIVFYAFLAKKIGRETALLFTLILAFNKTIFVHSTFAYTNLPYTTVIFSSLVALELYIRKDRREFFFLSLIFAILSIMMRSLDPFYFLIAGFLLVHAVKKRRLIKDFLIFMVVILIAKYLFDSYFARDIVALTGHQLPLQHISKKAVINAFFNLSRMKEAIEYIYTALQDYYFYLLSFIIFSLLFIKSAKKEIGLAFFILFSVIILLPGVLFLSSYYEDWNRIPDSMARLMMILYPTILYYIASLEETGKYLESLFSSTKTPNKK